MTQSPVVPPRAAARSETAAQPPRASAASDGGRAARLRRLLLPDEQARALAEIFKMLGDPTRVRLLDALSKSALCVGDLAATIGLSESAVSHQLRLLRSTRVVRARRAGRRVFYTLDDQHVIQLFAQALEHVEESQGRQPGAASRERR
jgi:ArsR family transcriptional regulator, lead/cadmium/zinc/bismuth-responsive transcriptional repressor